MVPSIGRIVLYTLTEDDAAVINRRRADAMRSMSLHRTAKTGAVVHHGNTVLAGETYPLVITRVWGEGETALINGQVLLDGNDSLWTTSRGQGTAPGEWFSPPRVPSAMADAPLLLGPGADA